MELTTSTSIIRGQLTDRRDRLQDAIAAAGEHAELMHLLDEVDAALRRLDLGTYGRCETCHDAIEADRLFADPLVRFCLDHLTVEEQRSLEQDLELAARIQQGLLPSHEQQIDGWDIAYDYRPAGVVSGDYCDVIRAADGGFYFMLGDVSGKGVAASMLMAHLHAMFRTLASLDMPLSALMERSSRAFCESTLPTHYATLVCGRAALDGRVEVCNAGHLPIIVTGTDLRLVSSSSLPIGMFWSEHFKCQELPLARGDTFVLATDGVTELENLSGEEYGIERLAAAVHDHRGLDPAALVGESLRGAFAFAGRSRQADDMTVLAIRRR